MVFITTATSFPVFSRDGPNKAMQQMSRVMSGMTESVNLRTVLMCAVSLVLGLVASELSAQYPRTALPPRAVQQQPITNPNLNPRLANYQGDRSVNPPSRSVQNSSKLFEPTTVLATVGPEYIMTGDLLPQVEMVMWNYVREIPEAERIRYKDDIARQKETLLGMLLQQAIDSKVLYVAFRRSLKSEELETLEERLDMVAGEAFDGAIEEMLPRVQTADKKGLKELRQEDMHVTQLCMLMAADNVESLRELDQILRQFGSSYQMEKIRFAEVNFGRQLIVQNVNLNAEITHQDMLDYYHEHAEDYRLNARARWQQISALYKNHTDPKQAYAVVCDMGNRVLQGAKFDVVAFEMSEDLKAKTGGFYDWIEPGNLVSQPLDKAVFSLPVNRMSPVITDEKGAHIIRVLERVPAGKQSFEDVQKDIRKQLMQDYRNEAVQAFIAQVKKEIPVWNALETKQK